jgi:hypothetical protein
VATNFLSAVSGIQALDSTDGDEIEFGSSHLAYILYIDERARSVPFSVYLRLLRNPPHSPSDRNSVFELLTVIISSIESPDQQSLNDIVEALNGYLNEFASDAMRNEALQLVFSTIGWVTCLYVPIGPDGVNRIESFQVHPQNSKVFSSLVIPLAYSSKSITDILHMLGHDLFPVKGPESVPNAFFDANQEQVTRCFVVSHMNADTLCKIGNITIEWVDSFPAHLDLDLVHRRLFLFRLPSYCEIHISSHSLLSRYVAILVNIINVRC